MAPKPRPVEERLLAKVEKTESGCWIWTGADNGKAGYGRIRVGNNSPLVHRVAYEVFKGPIPEGLHIDHLCRVKLCVNPEHLEAVTQAENSRRGPPSVYANSLKTECKRGHPFSEENTYVNPAGKRVCRLCMRDAQARFRQKNLDELRRRDREAKAKKRRERGPTSS